MDNRTSEPLWMERQEAREQEASSCSGKQTNKKTGKAIFRLKEEHKNNISDSCCWKRFFVSLLSGFSRRSVKHHGRGTNWNGDLELMSPLVPVVSFTEKNLDLIYLVLVNI